MSKVDSLYCKCSILVYCVILCFLLMHHLHVIFPGKVFISPDSYSYYTLLPSRVPGYGIFMYLVSAVVGSIHGVVVFQVILYFASLGFLAYAVSVVIGKWWVGILVIAILAGSESALLSTSELLTESLFVSLLMLCISFILLTVCSGLLKNIIMLGATLAMLIIIRPVGYAVLALIPFIVFINFSETRFKVLWAALAPIIIIVSVSTYNWYKYENYSLQMMGGFALLGNVGWNIQAEEQSEHYQMELDLETKVARVINKRPVSLTYPWEYHQYTANEYNTLLWGNIVPVLRSHMDREGILDKYPYDINMVSQINEVALDVALNAIIKDLHSYTYHVFAHYAGAWRYLFLRGTYKSGGFANNTCSKYDSSEYSVANASELWGGVINYKDYELHDRDICYQRSPFDYIGAWQKLGNVSLLHIITFIVSLSFIPLYFLSKNNKNKQYKVLALMSLLLHGYFFLVALTQVTIPRYVWVAEPIALVMLITFISLILSNIKTTFRKKLVINLYLLWR